MSTAAARLDAFSIFEDGKKLDTVFYSAGLYSADEIRKALIEHDGHSPHIIVKKQ